MGTPPREYSILAFRPPGNVERTINELRSRLFARTLALSTQALPPSVHLAYVEPDTPLDLVSPLPQERIAPLVVGPPRVVGKTVVISCTFDEDLAAWIAGLEAGPAPESLPCPCLGLYVGAEDLLLALGNQPAQDDTLTIPELEGLALPGRISVFDLQLMVIRVGDVHHIWSDIEWEVRWKKRVKFRGQAVTT